MVALEQLSEEEEALWLLLSDPTGCDQAEFFLLDTAPDTEDGITRLWDFQWPYLHCDDTYQVDMLARLTGKSLSVSWRSMPFAVLFPDQQMVLAAPEEKHLSPLVDKVKAVFDKSWLFDQMRSQKGSKGVSGKPSWQLTLLNGATILSRLPGRDGKGMKSLHPVMIEMDEIQDMTYAAYNETVETLKFHTKGLSWRMHGVSKGKGRDLHYAVTQGHLRGTPGRQWKCHQYTAMHRPTWNDDERRTKIAQYGGDESHPEYVRNVYGLPSDAGSAIFVLARLNACADRDDVYNDEIYSSCKFTAEEVGPEGDPLEFVHIPMHHLSSEFTSYWGGMDYGYAQDPSEILMFGTERASKKDRLLLRVHMERLSTPMQAEVVWHLFDMYGKRLKRFGEDSTSAGSGLAQVLVDPKRVAKDVADRIVGYNWSTKIPVAFDEQSLEKDPAKRAIFGYAKDFGTDTLRTWVDTSNIILADDAELLGTWAGATAFAPKSTPTNDGPVRRGYGGSSLHILDAGRMYACAKALLPIDTLLTTPTQESVVACFLPW